MESYSAGSIVIRACKLQNCYCTRNLFPTAAPHAPTTEPVPRECSPVGWIQRSISRLWLDMSRKCLMRKFYTVRIFVIFVATFAVGVPAADAQGSPKPVAIVIDANAPSHPFPHFWEKMFGSGRAVLSLRDSYRRDLRAVKQVPDFES